MNSAREQAAFLLQQQSEKEREGNDPLNDARKDATAQILAHLLGSDGFAVLVVSNTGGKTEGVSLGRGVLDPVKTLAKMLVLIEASASQLGINLEARIQDCDCPECRAERGDRTVH